MMKTNFKSIYKLIDKLFLITFLLTIIFISISYSYNFDLLNHKKTLLIGNNFYFKTQILSDLEFSKSIIELNPSVIQKQLNKMDYVESSKVSKIFPNTLLIEIIENNPLLYFKNNENLIIIDEKYNFLPVNNRVKNYFNIPIVDLTNIIDVNEKLNKLDLSLFKEIIQLLVYSKINLKYMYNNLNNIHINNNSYELSYMDDTKIFLSKNKAAEQLINLNLFKETIQKYRLLKHYLYIDMRIPNQIIVKENKIF